MAIARIVRGRLTRPIMKPANLGLTYIRRSGAALGSQCMSGLDGDAHHCDHGRVEREQVVCEAHPKFHVVVPAKNTKLDGHTRIHVRHITRTVAE